LHSKILAFESSAIKDRIRDMPWVIGIDEAGYGPNLGPLVQAAALARVPADDLGGWLTFRCRVRRAHDPRDARFLVDDSKKAFAKSDGEADVHRTLKGWRSGLDSLLARCGVQESATDYQAEPWHVNDAAEPPLPAFPLADLKPTCVNVVTPARLNAILRNSHSKAAALQAGYVALVQRVLDGWSDSDAVTIVADKMGGRHYYAGLVQQAFPAGWVVTECESPAESRYRVKNLATPVTAVFTPRADGTSIAVALASMMAKCVREDAMLAFNRFWRKHVPGLAPTAGYPVDAKRFYALIEPAMSALGIDADSVWRKK
jgi:ribonuclease HII